jgi:hypothetical protein
MTDGWPLRHPKFASPASAASTASRPTLGGKGQAGIGDIAAVRMASVHTRVIPPNGDVGIDKAYMCMAGIGLIGDLSIPITAASPNAVRDFITANWGCRGD